jgi:hypothetical protein
MSNIYEQTPIRLAARLVSNPPVEPVDDNTGLAPTFWRGASIAFQFAVFDSIGACVDLTNIAFLQLVIQDASDSLVPIKTKTVMASSIYPTITVGSWTDGTDQQASFVLDPYQTDISLNGGTSREVWLMVYGQTNTGSRIVYCAGYITIYNPGNLPAPSNTSYSSYHAQTSLSGNSVVSPIGQLHTEDITVSGLAGQRAILLTKDRLNPGAIVIMRFVLPEVDAIAFTIFDTSLAGEALATFQTQASGEIPSAFLSFVLDFGLVWKPLNFSLPAF